MQSIVIYLMADNYLEKKYEELQARKAKEQRAKQIAWKKRMDAYRKKLAALSDVGTLPEDTSSATSTIGKKTKNSASNQKKMVFGN